MELLRPTHREKLYFLCFSLSIVIIHVLLFAPLHTLQSAPFALSATPTTHTAMEPVEPVPETEITALLTKFGVPPETLQLTKGDFVNSLQLCSLDVLERLREDTFATALAVNFVREEHRGLPLVRRVNSAVRPLPLKLAEDIWVIIQCLQNGECIPRVLLRNGKQSQIF